jgi:hypothetical protein
VSLVWPLETSVRVPARSVPVETKVATNQRDEDDGAGEPAAGDVAGATETGNPAKTDAPLSPDRPAAQGYGDLALDTPLPERSPAPAPGVLVVDSAIAVPVIPVTEAVPAANGNANANAAEQKENGDGGGIGSILDGIGDFLGGVKVSGGMGGGGTGEGGMGGGGKGGCVPGIGGIIGGKGGGRPGTVAIPQGPGIRTGIPGRGRFPFAVGGGPMSAPSRTSAC